jgi:hypothetical protein
MMTNSFKVKKPQMGSGRNMTPGTGLPFYKADKMKSYNSTAFGNYMWMFGGYK